MASKAIDVEVERTVDGDTVRVLINGKSEAGRIQGLDIEESKPGGDKPQTPRGKEAAAHAAELFVPGKTVRLDFDVADYGEVNIDLSRFRDNFGRLLALVMVDEMRCELPQPTQSYRTECHFSGAISRNVGK